MPRTPKIKFKPLAQALKEFDGDFEKTAEHFKVTVKHIRDRIRRSPQLRSIWTPNSQGDPEPDEVELLARGPVEVMEPSGKKLLNALDKNSKEVFQRDLDTLLSNPDNVAKLRIFEEFDDSVGLLMAEALRITQKVNIRQNMSLFEVTEAMKDDLQDDGMDTEERILKTRLYISACEQQGKFYDRLLKGLDTMLKLTEKSTEASRKKKPGFQPLRELKKIEEDAAS
jgi:hypothetical protein